MISCKRATELVSHGLDERLSAGQRLRLAAHLLICSFCRRFKTQIELIRKGLEQSQEREAVGKETKLSDEEKRQMLAQIRKQLDL